MSRIWFRGGSVAEVANSSGSTALLQKLMQRQTLNRQSSSLGRELDGLGTQYRGTDVSWMASASAQRCIARSSPISSTSSTTLCANPRFGLVELERASQQQYREIQRQDRMLYARRAQLMRQAAWGTHGYAFPEFGTPETVEARARRIGWRSCRSRAVIPATRSSRWRERWMPNCCVEFLELYMGRWSDLSDLFPEGAEAFFASEFIDPLPVIEDGA